MWILYDDPLRLHLPYANYGSTSSSSSSNSRAGNDGGTEEEDYVADWESNVAYRIKQRYALATLYYALHIEEGNMIHHGWLGSVVDECEFVEGKNGQQRQAWEGVGCDDEGNVRVLMLGKFSFICSVSFVFLVLQVESQSHEPLTCFNLSSVQHTYNHRWRQSPR